MPTSPEARCQIEGTYVVVDPPRKLVLTWKGRPTENANTLVTVELTPVQGGTELRLTHEMLPTLENRTAHMGGWMNMLDHLEAALKQ